MNTWTLNSESALSTFLGDIRELWKRSRFLKVTAKDGSPRSLDQNAISHAWYAQLADELREFDDLGWKCFCKLHFGVPILRAEDAEFRSFYDAGLKGLSYEQKISAMKFVPVTSLMTKAQLSKYLEAMQADFVGRGVVLEFPESA